MNRDQLMQELGLAPLWRLRRQRLAPAGPAPLPALHVAREAAPRESVVAGTTHDARGARIAALQWRDFASDVAACTACELCKTRRRPVPGVGDVRAQWMFVGEAPGAEEDERGEPFVGQAGRLLDNMLLALGMRRDKNVYIANVLKCRPPGNRAPTPLETLACRAYLDRQIELIGPKLLIALGRSAATTLLEADATIASMRGRVHRYRGVPLIVTYHPAYLLRNLPDKAKAWEDLCLARATMRTLQVEADLRGAGRAPN